MPLLVSLVLLAQPQVIPEPRIVHAQQETRAVSSSLEREFRALVQGQDRAAWIAYTVPRATRGGDSCYHGIEAPPAGRAVMLEGGRQAVILYRVERRQVGRIRAYAIDCEIDAGDLPLYWLTGVRPGESVQLLDTFTRATVDSRMAQSLGAAAVYAIGAHADPAVLDLLIMKARTEKVRAIQRAAFSAIGRLQDPRAFAFLQEIIER